MDVAQVAQSDAFATNLRLKPAVPKKPEKLAAENDVKRKTHVRDMIRKLQEREWSNEPSLMKTGGNGRKAPTIPEKAEADAPASHQTLEDLKAIDEDIEKLRRQIEERDKIISALREAAETKDKKLDDFMAECSRHRSRVGPDVDATPEPQPSKAFCSGEPCWTGDFVRGLLQDPSALQDVRDDLRTKPGTFGTSKGESPKPERENRPEGGENAINLIMAEQIRLLKEREAQLIWEAEELREQNDLMEFRILELEESRKEFLDKEMMSEGKHRSEKIVWRERDLEEVSDSGVVSLPTSEDLTSDSELGDAPFKEEILDSRNSKYETLDFRFVRNYSPLGAFAHIGLSTTDNSHSEPGISDLKLKKSLKSAECLQESGIFVDGEPSDCAITAGSHSKACQTESDFDKALLDILDSSCDLFLAKNPACLEDARSDDLTTEISKLSVIQRRIQQKTKTPTPRNLHAVVSCPHANSVLFYEERLGQLEDKLKIYESSGDAQDILLAKRLQKEVELARQVKELTDKVASLEALNKKLEEEKCEFEEAENDARFQCQRLESRLQELIVKNADLELEVERRKAMMSEEMRKEKKKNSLEGLLNKYEKRNSELDEKEVETKKRLSMIEAAMPALVAYNVFKMVQQPDYEGTTPPRGSDAFLLGKKSETEGFGGLEEAAGEQKQEKTNCEGMDGNAADREKALRSRIRKLEAKADQDRAALEEMTNNLKAYEEAAKAKPSRVDDDDLFEELKHMVANEIELRAQIEQLEKKEQAYMQSLEKADEIWAGMEADYKRRLVEAEEANDELQKRVSRLEKSRSDLERSISKGPSESELSPPGDDVRMKILHLALENEKLKAELQRASEDGLQDRKKGLERENSSLKQELKRKESDSAREQRQIQILQKELELRKVELEHEKAVRERLKRELEEKGRSIASLQSDLQIEISKLTQELSQKSKELSSLEVTVAELREEVETLESKIAELVETIQKMIRNQEVSAVLRTRKELYGWPSPAGETVRRVLVNAPKLEEAAGEPPIADEIFVETKRKFLSPVEHRHRIAAFPVALASRQETRFVYARPQISKLVFLGTTDRLLKNFVPKVPKVEKQDKEKVFGAMEEEIFQLSIKNTELLQTLERMDEESTLKDKEFEELQKVALQIRKEQESIMSLYGKTGQITQNKVVESVSSEYETTPLEESGANGSIEYLQIINPIVIKTSERVSPSLSSLQIALDNLQSKHRWKSPWNGPLLDDKRDGRDAGNFAEQLTVDFPTDREAEEKVVEDRFSRPIVEKRQSALKPGEDHTRTQSSSPVASSFRRQAQKSNENPEFSFAAPITTVRKVGDDGIFLEWDLSGQPEEVVGYEIKVNGLLSHRVRSSTRNKALLRPLNLKGQISIHLFAVTKSGRSIRSSQVNYPDEYFLQREESSSFP